MSQNSMRMTTKRLLVIDENLKTATSLKQSLNELSYEADIADADKTGKLLALSGLYDLILIAVKNTSSIGFQFCRIVRDNNYQIPILILSASEEIEDKLWGFECGCDDFLSVPFNTSELKARIKVLLRRAEQIPVSIDKIRIADLEINRYSKTIFRNNTHIKLSSKEFNLLEYLAVNKGKVVSRSELSEKAWNRKFDQSSNIVDVYINSLRNKMDNGFNPNLIQTRIGFGYVMQEQ